MIFLNPQEFITFIFLCSLDDHCAPFHFNIGNCKASFIYSITFHQFSHLVFSRKFYVIINFKNDVICKKSREFLHIVIIDNLEIFFNDVTKIRFRTGRKGNYQNQTEQKRQRNNHG